MPTLQTIQTLGPPSRRTEFTYTGSVKNGVVLYFESGRVGVSSNFFEAILNCFRGASIPGGFSMTAPTPGGFGVWVDYHSQQKNHVRLNPRHASFIAAILAHEGYITSSLKGNAVMLHFPFEPSDGRIHNILKLRDARINCNIPVVLEVDGSLVMVPCDNISIKGMFIKGSIEIKEGTEVSIRFRLPVESKTNPIIRAKGHVVWINNKRSMQSKVPVGFGIQLDEIVGENINKRLMTFIEANKA